MTLEEAKKEIDELCERRWEAYDKTLDTGSYHEALALEDALAILDEVEEDKR